MVITICILLLFCSISFAQEPKKKDNAILVKTDTTGIFKKIKLYLVEKGYSIDKEDKEIMLINSGEKTLKCSMASNKITAFVKDSIVVITGLIAIDMTFNIGSVKTERTFDPVDFSGLKGSCNKLAWQEMEDLATHLGGSKFYVKQ